MLSRLVVSPSDVRHYLTIFEKDGKNAMAFLRDLYYEILICSISQPVALKAHSILSTSILLAVVTFLLLLKITCQTFQLFATLRNHRAIL